jgi:hypothetical protein
VHIVYPLGGGKGDCQQKCTSEEKDLKILLCRLQEDVLRKSKLLKGANISISEDFSRKVVFLSELKDRRI